MRKVNMFFNEEKEESWLNEMSAQGWQLQKFRPFLYTFEKGAPREYTYRIDYLQNFGFGKEAAEYIDFVESTGAEVVQRQFNWVCFRQHKSLGEFELYSDTSSKLKFVNRLLVFFLTIIFVNLLLITANGSISIVEGTHSIFDFLTGVSMGMNAVLIIPTISLILRRRNLKKKTALFQV